MHIRTGALDMAKSLRKYMGNGDVRNAIRRLGKQIAAELDDKAIFLSAEFYNYADKLLTFILRKYKLYDLNIQYNTDLSAPVAYTDGKKIVLNAGNPLTAHPKLLEGRFKVLMGIAFHEAAHKLFLDFDTHNKGITALENGVLFGKFDYPAGSDLEDNYRELEKAMQDGYGMAMTSVYAEVLNIINDGHDEAAMKQCFPGFIAQCITAAGNAQIELSTPLSDLIPKGVPELSCFYNLMLQYAKFGYCHIGEESDATEAYTQAFLRLEPVIDEALAEDDYLARWTHINTMVLILWPKIREMLNEDPNSGNGSGQPQSGGGSQSGSGGSGGGSGSQSGGNGNQPLTPEAAANALQQAAAGAQANNSAAPAPVGSGKSVSAQAVAAAQDGSNPNGNDALASIMDQIGQEMAAQAVQKEIDQAQLDQIRNSTRPLIHKKVPLQTVRHHDADKVKYESIFKEVEPYVRNLISSVLVLLRECNQDALIRHKRTGPIIEATEAYRPDGAFFAKRKLPEDRPNMAMCILLDESGSMYGDKMDISKKAMVLLERFAAGIGVPLMIAGHYTSGSKVKLNIYTDYISAKPEEDRYALGSIESHGCNRDGLPLRLCAEMLAQRPEEIRMMVVISDDSPNHDGYEGKEAMDDIKKTVSEFRRKGLTIYGAAIDEDRDVIRELYGNGFLSISDLKSLPKTMVRLMRQSII